MKDRETNDQERSDERRPVSEGFHERRTFKVRGLTVLTVRRRPGDDDSAPSFQASLGRMTTMSYIIYVGFDDIAEVRLWERCGYLVDMFVRGGEIGA